jgi:hypothetical protein
MSIEFWTGKQEFEHQQEEAVKRSLVKSLREQFESSNDTAFAVFNFFCSGSDIDLAFFKPNGVVVVEVKECAAKIVGGVNGQWHIHDESGRILALKGGSENRNPFDQAKRAKERLRGCMEEHRFGFLPSQKAESMAHENTFMAKAVVAISPRIHPQSELKIDRSYDVWFRVCGIEELPDLLHDLRDRNLNYTGDELRKFIKEVLCCEPLREEPKRAEAAKPPLVEPNANTTISTRQERSRGDLAPDQHRTGIPKAEMIRFLQAEIKAKAEKNELNKGKTMGAQEDDGSLAVGAIIDVGGESGLVTILLSEHSRHSKMYPGSRVDLYDIGGVARDAACVDIKSQLSRKIGEFEMQSIDELQMSMVSDGKSFRVASKDVQVAVMERDYGDDYLIKLMERIHVVDEKTSSILGAVDREGPRQVPVDDKDLLKKLEEINRKFPRFVQGPPGTGKTHLIAQLALKRISSHKADSVLIAARTNSAIDAIHGEIMDLRKNEGLFSPIAVKKYSRSRIDRGRYDVAVTLEPRPNTVILITLNALVFNRERARAFPSIIVDEASQLTLCEMMFLESLGTDVIFFGDPRQLGPIVIHRDADREIADGLLYLYGKKRFLVLRQTWRLNAEVAGKISKWFYNELLTPHEDLFTPASDIPRGIHVAKSGSGYDESYLKRADNEALIIRKLIERVRKSHPFEEGRKTKKSSNEQDIIISCLYRQQVTRIENALGPLKKGVLVDSVERTQGRTATYLGVLSVAGRPIPDDPSRFAWICDHRRLNVAISRSKVASVVVADEFFLDEVCSERNKDPLSRAAWQDIRTMDIPLGFVASN